MTYTVYEAMPLSQMLARVQKYYPGDGYKLVEKAYLFAQEAHKNQYRKSGEPYFTHPCFVASILVELSLDPPTIAAGLLHDTVEDCEGITLDTIRQEFGEEVAMLVDGVTKLNKLDFADKEEAQAESLRKMILAMGKDIRVVLIKLADRLHIPVVNTMMAKGIIPYNNKYSLWTIGIPQKDYQNKVLDMADLVIAVGYDIVEFAPGKWNGEGKHKIIHIDQRPAHINMLYQPEVEVVGDISYSLQQILYRSDAKEEPEEFLKLREEMVAEYESYADDTSFPMKPQKILYDVRKFMGADDIVISDVGAHKMWIAREYNCYEPNTCIISNGFATMGIAVPGAVAAKLIYPEKKVLAISGDGGFMMNSQEYETALREGTPIVTLIFSDASYGLIKWKQMDHFGHNCFVDFQNPDFVKYAESMHAKGYRVEKAEDLLPILEDAFQQKVPCIIDCPVDYSENTKLSEYLHDKFEK